MGNKETTHKSASIDLPTPVRIQQQPAVLPQTTTLPKLDVKDSISLLSEESFDIGTNKLLLDNAEIDIKQLQSPSGNGIHHSQKKSTPKSDANDVTLSSAISGGDGEFPGNISTPKKECLTRSSISSNSERCLFESSPILTKETNSVPDFSAIGNSNSTSAHNLSVEDRPSDLSRCAIDPSDLFKETFPIVSQVHPADANRNDSFNNSSVCSIDASPKKELLNRSASDINAKCSAAESVIVPEIDPEFFSFSRKSFTNVVSPSLANFCDNTAKQRETPIEDESLISEDFPELDINEAESFHDCDIASSEAISPAKSPLNHSNDIKASDIKSESKNVTSISNPVLEKNENSFHEGSIIISDVTPQKPCKNSSIHIKSQDFTPDKVIGSAFDVVCAAADDSVSQEKVTLNSSDIEMKVENAAPESLPVVSALYSDLSHHEEGILCSDEIVSSETISAGEEVFNSEDDVNLNDAMHKSLVITSLEDSVVACTVDIPSCDNVISEISLAEQEILNSSDSNLNNRSCVQEVLPVSSMMDCGAISPSHLSHIRDVLIGNDNGVTNVLTNIYLPSALIDVVHVENSHASSNVSLNSSTDVINTKDVPMQYSSILSEPKSVVDADNMNSSFDTGSATALTKKDILNSPAGVISIENALFSPNTNSNLNRIINDADFLEYNASSVVLTEQATLNVSQSSIDLDNAFKDTTDTLAQFDGEMTSEQPAGSDDLISASSSFSAKILTSSPDGNSHSNDVMQNLPNVSPVTSAKSNDSVLDNINLSDKASPDDVLLNFSGYKNVYNSPNEHLLQVGSINATNRDSFFASNPVVCQVMSEDKSLLNFSFNDSTGNGNESDTSFFGNNRFSNTSTNLISLSPGGAARKKSLILDRESIPLIEDTGIYDNETAFLAFKQEYGLNDSIEAEDDSNQLSVSPVTFDDDESELIDMKQSAIPNFNRQSKSSDFVMRPSLVGISLDIPFHSSILAANSNRLEPLTECDISPSFDECEMSMHVGKESFSQFTTNESSKGNELEMDSLQKQDLTNQDQQIRHVKDLVVEGVDSKDEIQITFPGINLINMSCDNISQLNVNSADIPSISPRSLLDSSTLVSEEKTATSVLNGNDNCPEAAIIEAPSNFEDDVMSPSCKTELVTPSSETDFVVIETSDTSESHSTSPKTLLDSSTLVYEEKATTSALNTNDSCLEATPITVQPIHEDGVISSLCKSAKESVTLSTDEKKDLIMAASSDISSPKRLLDNSTLVYEKTAAIALNTDVNCSEATPIFEDSVISSPCKLTMELVTLSNEGKTDFAVSDPSDISSEAKSASPKSLLDSSTLVYEEKTTTSMLDANDNCSEAVPIEVKSNLENDVISPPCKSTGRLIPLSSENITDFMVDSSDISTVQSTSPKCLLDSSTLISEEKTATSVSDANDNSLEAEPIKVQFVHEDGVISSPCKSTRELGTLSNEDEIDIIIVTEKIIREVESQLEITATAVIAHPIDLPTVLVDGTENNAIEVSKNQYEPVVSVNTFDPTSTAKVKSMDGFHPEISFAASEAYYSICEGFSPAVADNDDLFTTCFMGTTQNFDIDIDQLGALEISNTNETSTIDSDFHGLSDSQIMPSDNIDEIENNSFVMLINQRKTSNEQSSDFHKDESLIFQNSGEETVINLTVDATTANLSALQNSSIKLDISAVQTVSPSKELNSNEMSFTKSDNINTQTVSPLKELDSNEASFIRLDNNSSTQTVSPSKELNLNEMSFTRLDNVSSMQTVSPSKELNSNEMSFTKSDNISSMQAVPPSKELNSNEMSSTRPDNISSMQAVPPSKELNSNEMSSSRPDNINTQTVSPLKELDSNETSFTRLDNNSSMPIVSPLKQLNSNDMSMKLESSLDNVIHRNTINENDNNLNTCVENNNFIDNESLTSVMKNEEVALIDNATTGIDDRQNLTNIQETLKESNDSPQLEADATCDQQEQQPLESEEDRFEALQEEVEYLRKAKCTLSTAYHDTMCSISDQLNNFHGAKKQMTSDISDAMFHQKDVRKERDQAWEDIRNVEKAFSELMSRYEKTKSVLEQMKENEVIVKNQNASFEAEILDQEKKYNLLQNQAEERLELSNEELVKTNKEKDSQKASLSVMLRRAEIKIRSLSNTLEQKVDENAELSRMCDEFATRP